MASQHMGVTEGLSLAKWTTALVCAPGLRTFSRGLYSMCPKFYDFNYLNTKGNSQLRQRVKLTLNGTFSGDQILRKSVRPSSSSFIRSGRRLDVWILVSDQRDCEAREMYWPRRWSFDYTKRPGDSLDLILHKLFFRLIILKIHVQ